MDSIPKDVIVILIDFLWNTELSAYTLTSLSATSSRYRHLVLPTLLSSPHFTPLSLPAFHSLILPRYSHFVSSLFHLGWDRKNLFIAQKEAALEILAACKGTLRSLSLDVPFNWIVSIVSLLEEGGWDCLYCLKVDIQRFRKDTVTYPKENVVTYPKENVVTCSKKEIGMVVWEDVLGCVPCSVKCLVVEGLRLEDFRRIGEKVNWLEEVEVEMETRKWREEEIRAEVRFFLDRNPLLKSVSHVIWYSDKVFSLMDWILLDECVLRGILLKRKGYVRGSLTWEKFIMLPESVPIQNAIKILKQYAHFTSWKLHLSDLMGDPLYLSGRIEMYQSLVKEFNLKKLTIRVDDWSSELFLNLLKLMDETGRIQYIQHLEILSFISLPPTYEGGFTKFLMGCVSLKRITVNCDTLMVLRLCTLPPISLTLVVASDELPLLDEEHLKCLSTMSSLHLCIPYGPLIKTCEKICQLFNNWKEYNIPIPNTIRIDVIGLSLNKNPEFNSFNQKVEYIENYLLQHMWLWKLNYQIMVEFKDEGFKITNSQENQ